MQFFGSLRSERVCTISGTVNGRLNHISFISNPAVIMHPTVMLGCVHNSRVSMGADICTKANIGALFIEASVTRTLRFLAP